MNSELRPHQVLAMDALKKALLAGRRRPIIQLPTGAGKTVVAAAIVDGALRKGNRVTFVVPALSLVDQTVQSFWSEGIRDVGVMQGSHEMTHAGRAVQVATVQTLERREIPESEVVVIDEAHRWHRFYGEWMRSPGWERVPFIGLSATPWTRGLGKHFDDLIIAATTAELIEAGYLCPFHVFAPAHPDLSGVSTVAGDYHEAQLGEAMDKPTLTADVVETWRRIGEDRPTLVFAVTCAHARHLRDRFAEAGIGVAYIDAKTDAEERESIRKRFHAGDVRVVCNVGCLTTGVDWDVRCIVLARPTKSEMLYCLDSETEILTSRGWKGMGEVREGDCAAACVGADPHSGRWAKITGVVERDMADNEAWVEYASPRANFRVTDRHRMLFRGAHERGGMRIAEAREMAACKGGAVVPTSVHFQQVGVPLTDDELYFIGMMMADGTWTSTAGSISQSERHPEVLARIEGALQGCGIGYAKKRVVPDGAYPERHPRWVFSFSAGKPKPHKRLGAAICGNPCKAEYTFVQGVTGYRHLLPYLDKDFAPALMQMSRGQLLTLLGGLWDGDGSKKVSVDYTPRSLEICSARKAMVDRLQALCAINGLTANLRCDDGPSRRTPIYLITITDRDWRHCGGYSTKSRTPRPQIEVRPATNERVWCVETETGTIITRRRGKVTVMGNCQMIGRGLRTAPGKADLRILDHSDTTLRLGFVTDIRHEDLHDGRKAPATERRERKEPLPKECPSCAFLKPPKVHQCPSCGFAPERQSDVEVEDGALVEVKGGFKPKPDEKRSWYAQLKGYAEMNGKSDKWVLANYRAKFDEWPYRKEVAPITPGPEVLGWIRHRQIAWAKSRKRVAA